MLLQEDILSPCKHWEFTKQGFGYSRFIYVLGVLFFPVLRTFIFFIKHSPCYWYTRFQYLALTDVERYKCRINVLLCIHPEEERWGHCWLTCNGRSIFYKKTLLGTKLEFVGSADKIDYWIPTYTHDHHRK